MLRKLVALQRMAGKNGEAAGGGSSGEGGEEGGGGGAEGEGEEGGALGTEVHIQAGCTAVVALVKDNYIYVANAGEWVGLFFFSILNPFPLGQPAKVSLGMGRGEPQVSG